MRELKTIDVVAMTSLEIAEATGKRHKNVLRDINIMLKELEIDRLKFEHIYEDSYGRDLT
jgi:phage regulator Rha-like protein